MVFETCLVLDYSLFTFLHTTPNCSLEEITDLVTMATTTWTSHINHGIMTFCRVMFAKISTTIPIKMNHHQVSIGMLYNTSPLTAITFCHISSNPMSVPKPFQYNLERRTQTTFGKKLIRIKIFVFEIAKVKVH